MKINWKLRLKNKYTLMALIGLAVGFIYTALGVFGVIPSISEEKIVELFSLFIELLVGLGIIVDPTTDGVDDSVQAMEYDNPKVHAVDEEMEDSEYKGGEDQ